MATLKETIVRLLASAGRDRMTKTTDMLTGAGTLPTIMAEGEDWLRKGGAFGIVRLDLGRFKAINDTYGYAVGDRVLAQVGSVLRREAERVGGKVGRIAGDEFVVLVPGPAVGGVQWAEQIKRILTGHKFAIDDELPPVAFDFSVGFSFRPEGEERSVDDMLREADRAKMENKYACDEQWRCDELNDVRLSPRAKQLLQVVSEKDMYTFAHSRHVALFASWLAEDLKLSGERLIRAGWLHDVGKILVPSRILLKTAPLTSDEYAVIQRHVEDGLHMLGEADCEPDVRQAIRCHHERWDGSGYPFGLKGEETPLEGRILQIADAFSAMTIKRVYQPRRSFGEALAEIRRLKGRQFDPELAERFADAVKLRLQRLS